MSLHIFYKQRIFLTWDLFTSVESGDEFTMNYKTKKFVLTQQSTNGLLCQQNLFMSATSSFINEKEWKGQIIVRLYFINEKTKFFFKVIEGPIIVELLVRVIHEKCM